MISAILLGAGESKRMGVDKLSLPFGMVTLLEKSLKNLLRSRVKEIIVVLNRSRSKMLDHLKGKRVKVVFNPYYKKGMSSSIRCGLRFTNSRSNGILIAFGDQPFLKPKTINTLIKRFYQSNKGIVLPLFRGEKGHPVIFHRRYKKELLRLKGDVGGRSIIKKFSNDVLLVPVKSNGVIKDIDTLNDYLRNSKIRLS